MFSYQFRQSSGTTLQSGTCPAEGTAGSAADYRETDVIDLTEKRHDGKNLSVFISVPVATGDSAASAYLDWSILGSYGASAVTFPIQVNSSGTSLILSNSSGTSQGAATEYRQFAPLTVSIGGATEWLKAIPFVKLGCRASQHRGSGSSVVPYTAWLMVG